MKFINLSQNEAAETGLTHKVVISAADLTEEATAQNVPVLTLGAGEVCRRVMARLNDAFVAGASTTASSLTVSVGTTDSTASLMTATQLDKNSANVAFKDGTGTHVLTTAATAVTPLVARFSGAANVSTITNGEVEVFFSLADLKSL
jgi:hypothetical protein